MARRHYTIICDESAKKGKYFSNFYGGVIFRSRDQEAIEAALQEKKEELNLLKELKWTSVTSNYVEKYSEFIDYYFTFIASRRLKTRIMFTQNMFRPKGLSTEQIDVGYFLLYYQLIKHGFGIRYSNPNALDRVYFNLLFDEMPDTKEKVEFFKRKLSEIPELSGFRGTRLHIPYDQIAEVDSKSHNILQGLDIILGAMNFRLNDLHLVKPEGSRRRGKRTIAKERLYKKINANIRRIYPNFNIGVSTGTANSLSNHWEHPYRHWNFRPNNHTVDLEAGKPR